MKHLFLRIGLSISLLVPVVQVQANTYREIYEQEKQRVATSAVSQPLEEYIPKIMPLSALKINAKHVDQALLFQKTEICIPENNNDKQVFEQKCQSTMGTIHELIQNTTWLQSVVRNLQLSATSYELGTNYYGGGTTAVLTRIQSIATIWQSDIDSKTSPFLGTKVRAGIYPEDTGGKVGNITSALESLLETINGKTNNEKYIAAVWRYRNGVKILGSTCPEDNSNRGDGTELQFLTARFCEVEKALLALQKIIPPQNYTDDPLLYPIIKVPNLPVIVWVRSDDVGFTWQAQVEPVLPSMNCSEGYSYNQPEGICNTSSAILSGAYPDELQSPPLDQGLCSHPTAKRGYLCRKEYQAHCPENPNTANDIYLTECSSPNFQNTPAAFTDSGPNICTAGGWRQAVGTLPIDTPGPDTGLVAQECSNCVADIVCGNCAPGLTAKEENGRIVACVDENAGALSEFILQAQLTHVRQRCDAPPGDDSIWMKKYNTINGCCAAEYEAFTAACNGIAKIYADSSEYFDIAACAMAFANNTCGDIYGTPGSTQADMGICGNTGLGLPAKQVIENMQTYVEERADTYNIASSCSEAVENLSETAKSIKYSLPQVCSPECQAKYTNTIGNNACYIGACIEQSLEGNRVIPGRVTWTTQDASFPWDAERAPPSPLTGNSLVPSIHTTIPPYRPLSFVRQLDEAICQLYGLPSRSPPILCAYDPRRKLSTPSASPGHFAVGLQLENATLESAQEALRTMSAGIGARLGAAFYTQYFDGAMQSFYETLLDANGVITSIEQAEFSNTMCPLQE